MEERQVLNAQTREHTGTSFAKSERTLGRIPAIIYGHKKESVAVSVDAHDFMEQLHHGRRFMDLKVGKKKETVLVKELQYDHLGKNVIHVDLMRVEASETVKVSVPIELKGVAKGAGEGGVIESHADHLDIECTVTQIPEKITVSVKDIGLDDRLFAKDIPLPEGAKLASDPETLVLTCGIIAEIKTTEEVVVTEPIVPEVISKGKEVEEEQAPEEKQ
jgi:large subunit ribosomal protein L25